MSTKIAWTQETWNPSVGCTRVSSGCDNCYAFALHDRRYVANIKAGIQQGVLAKPQAARAHGVTLPFPPQYDVPFSKIQLLESRLDIPLHWRKPRRVFVDSMSDLFHEDVPAHWVQDIFTIMRACPQHTFQILTKRPERMRDLLTKVGIVGTGVNALEPLPNVWLGVSVENQETADERIPLLLETPAAVRWVSAEPLLGPVDLHKYLGVFGAKPADCPEPHERCGNCNTYPCRLGYARPGLDWVVVGGESGPHARPMDRIWVWRIHDDCADSGAAYFGKQDSGARPGIALPGDLGDREYP